VDRVVIALGSNVGDRAAHLDFAVSRLRDLLSDLRVSSYHETVPQGVPGEQPLFLNAVVAGETNLDPRGLLGKLLAIEQERGRERPHVGAPRTLDLDLVLFGDQVVESGELIVPHPRFRERSFVLEPLVEVAADARDPVTGRTAAELLARLRRQDAGAHRP
jgi:2-amino-4-hydroxy-6-hydroxymethyldihydropteridine diphosphokinase